MASIPCPDGCGKCCGLFPFPKEIWEKHKDKAQYPVEVVVFGDEVGVTPAGKPTLDCVFLDKKRKCLIYADRPEICREYGGRKCPCPFFTENGVPRTRQDKRRIERVIESQNRQAYRKLELAAKMRGLL